MSISTLQLRDVKRKTAISPNKCHIVLGKYFSAVENCACPCEIIAIVASKSIVTAAAIVGTPFGIIRKE